MEQFVLGSDSVYNNKSLDSESVTEKEHPKYQAEQYPTFQNGSHKKTEKKQKTVGQSRRFS